MSAVSNANTEMLVAGLTFSCDEHNKVADELNLANKKLQQLAADHLQLMEDWNGLLAERDALAKVCAKNTKLLQGLKKRLRDESDQIDI